MGARKLWRLQDQSLAVKVGGKLGGISFVWKVTISSYMACLYGSVRHPVIQHRICGSQPVPSINYLHNFNITPASITRITSTDNRNIWPSNTCCIRCWLWIMANLMKRQTRLRLFPFLSFSTFCYRILLQFFLTTFPEPFVWSDVTNVGFSVSKPLNNIVTNLINRWHHYSR